MKSFNYFKRFPVIAVFAICFNFIAIHGQSKADKIETLLKKYVENDQFNGAVLVAEGGDVIYSNGFGMANFEHNVPNKTDTKFRIASITKQFTAALILQLVEEGKLELDKPISAYLPNYKGPAADVVTIHHLLTHTSGIPSYTSFPGFFESSSRDPYTPDELIKTFQDSTLQFTPGEKFVYNNSGYVLLGRIIEEVTGKTYEQVLQERIFDPLGMTNSGYDHSKNILKNRAAGYEREGDQLINAPYLDMSLPYAAGSIYSTVEDLYLWDQALYGNKILSEESKKLMFAHHIPAGNGFYGYGWGLGKQPLGKTKDSVEVMAHSGGINGFNTLITRYPESRNFVVLLNNTGSTDLDAMTNNINSILHGLEVETPKKSIAREVTTIFMDKGAAAGLARIKELQANPAYEVKEDAMNSLGYQLLQNGKHKEAIAVFQFNVAQFPDSWNVYDSLGEAYMVDGQKDLAIKNYKKSIEMNPANTNGKEMLAKIQQQK